MTWSAVILAGGTAVRLDGADKAALEHDGRSLLAHALTATAGASETVVVGPVTETTRPVTFTRETPAGGGPLAGLAAGVAALRGPGVLVAVLAVDMPHVTASTLARLLSAAEAGQGAWLVDRDGRRQLAGVVRRASVPAPEDAHGLPMRLLMERAETVDVPAEGAEAADIDTWDDVARLRDGASCGDRSRAGLEQRAPIREIWSVNLHDWIDELCDALDIETEVDEALVLDLAKVAADNVIRKAAPITTYLLGYAAGSADADVEEIERLAAKAQALAEQWDHPSGSPDPVDVDDDVPDDSVVDHTGDEYE
jgi:molybdopterin-guanine dinucleotide biosynthesis protein A